jgi:hypothetical protein
MINTNKHATYSSIDIPVKQKANNSIRNIIIAMGSLLVTFLSAYFLYSGYFVMNSGSVSRIRLSTEPIVIEFDSDDMSNVHPGSQAWIAFHDKLIADAGYNVQEVRSNPDISVTFVAYDAPASITEDVGRVIGGGNRNPDRIQTRSTAGITCFTKYCAGSNNAQLQQCLPTRRIKNPIRTGCSAYDGEQFVGSHIVGDFGCMSQSLTSNVAARCCQPTPKTEYEGADWSVTAQTVEDTDEDIDEELGCAAVGCANSHALVGCTGMTRGFSMFGCVQYDGNVCRAQRNVVTGEMVVVAVCASQPQDGHQLKCEAVYSMTAVTD